MPFDTDLASGWPVFVYADYPPPTWGEYVWLMEWDVILETRAAFRVATASPPPDVEPFAEEGSDE